MKKIILFTCISTILAACSSTSSNNVMYGEIKSGVETTRLF